MESIKPRLTLRDVFGYILAILLWLLAVSIALLAVFEARNAVNVVWPTLGSSPQWGWTLRAIDRFGLVFLGLVWLVYAIFCEHHYRSAITAVRMREYAGKRAPALEDGQASWAARQLARTGLDVLIPRVAVTLAPPILLWLLSLLAKALAFRLLLV